MKTIDYKKAKVIPSTLEALYSGSAEALEVLDKNLLEIIKVEAPITLTTLKYRLRESYNIAKISQKALDIILCRINYLGFVETFNFYDTVYWPSSGEFSIDYLREAYPREIYDIPYQEMKNLVQEMDYRGEELHRKILEYFGLQVLTHKASEYLQFIEKMCK